MALKKQRLPSETFRLTFAQIRHSTEIGVLMKSGRSGAVPKVYTTRDPSALWTVSESVIGQHTDGIPLGSNEIAWDQGMGNLIRGDEISDEIG